jgi:ATP-dependent Lon protease
VKNAIEIIPVRWIDKVLELALERVPAPIPEDEPKAASPVADKKDTPATGDFVKH